MSSNFLSVPSQKNARPGMFRTRSSSSPGPAQDESQTQTAADRPKVRPGHVRSRSYMSPSDVKPIAAATFPAPKSTEKPTEFSKLHRRYLSSRHPSSYGSTKEEVKDGKETKAPHVPHGISKHRYTQSEAQQYVRKRNSFFHPHENTGPSHHNLYTAESEHPNDMLYPSSRGAAIPSLMRLASTRSYLGPAPRDTPSSGGTIDPRTGLRRRASSDAHVTPTSSQQDPTSPQNTHRPALKTPIEMALERADHIRRTTISNATAHDLKYHDQQLRLGRDELHTRQVDTTRTASDLMRRLEDAHENLTQTTESLGDTISSFANLSDESSKLVKNFEHESRHLDKEIRGRVAYFRRTICGDRNNRVAELERRGRILGLKAQALGRRLETAREKVRGWEERETQKRKAWRGVWVGVLWGVGLILIAVIAGVASWKAAEVAAGEGTARDLLRGMIVENSSYDVHALGVPDDVKDVLVDIERRVKGVVVDSGDGVGVGGEVGRMEGDKSGRRSMVSDSGLRILDEL